MRLAPDGKRIAALAYDMESNEPAVQIIDVETMKVKSLVDSFRNYKRNPVRVNWINDGLLAVDFDDWESEAVNLSGKKLFSLGDRFIRTMTNPYETQVETVVVHGDTSKGELAQVDIRSGRFRRYSLPEGRPVQWAFDTKGALRAVTMSATGFWSQRTKISQWYRKSESDDWELLEEGPLVERHWVPMFVSKDDSLVVASRYGRDTRAVFRYDVRTRTHGELLAGHPNEDINAVAGDEQDVFTGVGTEGLKPKGFWFDKRWAKLQASVDAALPDRINVLDGNPGKTVLVHSWSDIDPGRWFVLDTASMTMTEIASARPHIDPKAMRPMHTLEYPSFDGRSVPAYLTLPAGKGGAAPLVVLIHGGPHVRDHWEWNDEVQFLAANGYAVFQPQFRGSRGFGLAFEEAGYKQWGRAMQDDITAGVEHLIARGIVDPQRICIYGASYGGYAALWGLVKTPKLYKCGISFAGVTDLRLLVNDYTLRSPDPVVSELWQARIGDLEMDSEELAAVSPLKHADRIQVPVFLAHGEADGRVSPRHSREMEEALKKHGKSYRARYFPREGHGLIYLAHRYSYYGELLEFLKVSIGVGEGNPN